MRASTLATLIALFISLFWGWLVAVIILSNNRPGAWYDVDFSIWMMGALYAFIHLFIGKILSLIVSGMVDSLEKSGKISSKRFWTEDIQMIFASLWPVSVPAAVIAYPILKFWKFEK